MPKILSAEKFCPPNFLSAEILSDKVISFFHIPDMKENKEESDDSHIAHLRKSLSSLIMGVLSRAACADQPLSFTAVNVITKFLIKTLREMVEENEASWGKSVHFC